MAWEENSRICLHMQLIAILSRIGVIKFRLLKIKSTDLVRRNEQRINRIKRILYSMKKIRSIRLIRCLVYNILSSVDPLFSVIF